LFYGCSVGGLPRWWREHLDRVQPPTAESIDEIVSKARGRFGVIDILINNAGRPGDGAQRSSEGGSSEEVCTTKEIRGAEVNLLSIPSAAFSSREGTEGSQTLRWREMDSNHRSPVRWTAI
jgi:NAD(P)-dependent dehydrogenase (short-subunit alcohol dehydrogenase family)